ncbi:hypothetical protein Pelsub_P0468 [Pelolinea submarina]|uniref:AIPR protein n=2 Tax=Pelolinea submarina TaxID=913107 RepID=A0A347ZPL0_9CHLR|nr:AIPR protein [Pelolinea submarina]BBB47241.1 hypothetical protein Pelsub_P0468 [Pelolinea submarina]
MNKRIFQTRMREEVFGYSKSISISSAFLLWFLLNIFHLEKEDAIDCICDQPNDKGIDGIFIDEDEEIIYLFQSKYSPKDGQIQGDNDLRNFIGAREWFKNESAITNLLNSTACEELKSLITSLKISEKTNYKLVSVFLTNKEFNKHSSEYINAVNDFEAYDIELLFQNYTYFSDDENIFPEIDLYLANKSRIQYDLSEENPTRVYAISAKQLIKLEGIQDRTLFYKNVRYGVGNTRVNKSIKETINITDEHENFFLYHNGITIICEKLVENLDRNKISIEKYAVINGCQSMLSFFENRNKLSNNLIVLVKIIQTNLTSPLVGNVTYYANNQNSIGLKDLHSLDSIQRVLQKKFKETFDNKVLYKRKRGEEVEGFEEVIASDFAAQLISSVYLNEPYRTHLKQELFGSSYSRIFTRKMTVEKIYLAKIIYEVVEKNAAFLKVESIRNYGLALFFFSYLISQLLDQDELGREILDEPREFVLNSKIKLENSLLNLWKIMIPEINYQINQRILENNGFFDYKNLFKNAQFIKDISDDLLRDYERLVLRDDNNKFSEIYKNS